MPGPTRTPTRRETLAVVGGLLGLAATSSLAGCGDGAPRPVPSTPPQPTVAADPDADLRNAVRRAEQELVALHEATAGRHPELGPVLAPLTEHHRQHAAAIAAGDRAGPTAVAGVPPATSSSATSPPATSPPATSSPVPDEPTAALAAVQGAEAAAAEARLLDCLASSDDDLATLLASAGAAEAAHAALLAGS